MVSAQELLAPQLAAPPLQPVKMALVEGTAVSVTL
jgi:hypothetical protein